MTHVKISISISSRVGVFYMWKMVMLLIAGHDNRIRGYVE